jgi:hypothetical protein
MGNLNLTCYSLMGRILAVVDLNGLKKGGQLFPTFRPLFHGIGRAVFSLLSIENFDKDSQLGK